MPLSLGELFCSVFADNTSCLVAERRMRGPEWSRPRRKRKKLAPLIFDPEELLARVENDRELLRDLLTIFKEDFPRQLLALREAVDAKDGDRVATAAHTLRGMLSNLAASRAAVAAARLEQMGRKKEILDFQEAFDVFQDDANKLLPQLDACMAEVCK